MNSTTEQVTAFISSLNWTAPTWDLFILVFFVIAALLYGVSLGRDRIIVIMVGLYMALAVIAHTPFITDLTAEININRFAVKFSIFIGLFVLFFFLLSRSALSQTLGNNVHLGGWLQVLIYSILHVGLLISITLSFLPSSSTDILLPLTRQVFLSDIGRFVWIVAPIAAMMVFKDKRY